MRNPLIFFLTVISVVLIVTNEISAQGETKSLRGFEIGIDFMRFNNHSNPFGAIYHPYYGKEFKFDFVPALFIRAPFGRNSLRFKYEYSQLFDLYSTKMFDFSSHVDGKLSDNLLLLGIERYFINSRLKFYGLIDFGLSFSNFKGFYSSFSGWTLEQISNEPQNIKAHGFSLNPGIGFKYQILKKINITSESSVGISKFSKKDDPHNIFVPSKLILKPISLVGVSYYISRKK